MCGDWYAMGGHYSPCLATDRVLEMHPAETDPSTGAAVKGLYVAEWDPSEWGDGFML